METRSPNGKAREASRDYSEESTSRAQSDEAVTYDGSDGTGRGGIVPVKGVESSARVHLRCSSALQVSISSRRAAPPVNASTPH